MPSTSPYLDPALYDVVYSKVVDDVPFYVDLARATGGPVLEVGCGTGRVLLPTLEAGLEIHGLDLEASMLDRLRQKAAARGLRPRVFQGDMRDFTMPERYRLATIPFRAILHMESTEDQIRALRCIREHLQPGGLLALNVFYPCVDFIALHDGARRLTIEVTHPETGLPVRVWDATRYERVRQIVSVEREVIQVDAQGRETTTAYGFALRWIYPFEMALLLRAAGFGDHEMMGGFDRRPLLKDTDEIVVVARRAG